MANQATTILFVQNPGGTALLDMQAIDGPLSFVMAKAVSPSATQGLYLNRLFGEPDLIAEATVDNALTPVATKLIDLTAQGLTFPATTMRQVKWRHWWQTDNDRYLVEYERWLLGGTTPVLLGTRRVIHAHGVIAASVVAYGALQLHATTSGGTVTVDTGSTSAGVSIGDFTSGASSLTFPLSRATPRVTFAHFAEDAGTIGDVRTIQARAVVVAGTGTVETFTSNGTEALSSPNGVNNLDLGLFALPPGDMDLVMNGNSVECQVTGIASDETRHRVELFFGRAIQVAFQGS